MNLFRATTFHYLLKWIIYSSLQLFSFLPSAPHSLLPFLLFLHFPSSLLSFHLSLPPFSFSSLIFLPACLPAFLPPLVSSWVACFTPLSKQHCYSPLCILLTFHMTFVWHLLYYFLFYIWKDAGQSWLLFTVL